MDPLGVVKLRRPFDPLRMVNRSSLGGAARKTIIQHILAKMAHHRQIGKSAIGGLQAKKRCNQCGLDVKIYRLSAMGAMHRVRFAPGLRQIQAEQ